MTRAPLPQPSMYRHTWPVEDTSMTRGDLVLIADYELRAIVAGMGRKMLSAPRWTWQHSNGPELVATVAVSGEVRQ